jgi:DNA-binding beta-propeller fold protein YncE
VFACKYLLTTVLCLCPLNLTKEKTKMRIPTSGKTLAGILQLICVVLIAGCALPQQSLKVQEIPVFPPPPDEARFFFERSIYTSADVVAEDKNANLRRLFTGEPRIGEGMGKPYGVAVFHGRVFVSDTALRYVSVFDIPNQRYFKIGEDEAGRMGTPLGLDVDGLGNLYVVDSSAKHVQVYDKDGKFLRTVGDAKMFSRPSGIAVDAEGSRIYVVDTGGVASDDHRVRVFDAQSGKHLHDIGKRGSAPGEFNLPRDVSIGKDGLLYVVDGANFRVQVFKPDGTFVRVFGGIGRQGGQFSRPKEVATDPDGNVYIVDSAFGNFQIFTPDGKLLLSVGSRGERDGMAKYLLPSGIAIDGDGRVYMVDQFYRKVDIYRPAKLAVDAGFAVRKEAAAKK